MEGQVSVDLLKKWLKAWSLSRKLPLPVLYKSGFKVEVGDEKQKERYVFAELNDDFFQLAESIDEPWIYLKVCTSPDHFIEDIPEKWKLQPQGYMMSCSHPMNIDDVILPSGYNVKYEQYDSTSIIRIVAENGEEASAGRVVLVDDLAVYDRIITHESHRRKGLASFLMKELEKIALSKDISNNFLVATEQGKLLYETLGWELYSVYTSIVIPST
ncbi:GNAT family N-acetyltransferase [Chryseobacterium sp. Tr-659]|uniref:GNAT family N-acetyltransferase n=1 Tax=Chryseobacterium sp. Tr-659 TaxID=2608340 RepID=UPI0014202CBC|nr:GNAT family N-acetyltransferase [Chryseobacterium sp. Tr-659]NIF04923.1 GNAT family N-acetyltransferase [Chryseobacterium sp. Tr-659]